MRYVCLFLVTICIGPPHVFADLIYGVDQTNLILIDADDPANSTIIGSHNLDAEFVPFSLAYDPINNALVGMTTVNASPYTRRLVQFNRTNGQATVLANLGGIDDVGLHEGIEFIDSFGALVTGKSAMGSTFASDLNTINLGGQSNSLLSTNPQIDNDQLVYDSLRDRLFSVDVASGDSTFSQIDLATGNVTSSGNLPSSLVDDLAYSQESDAFYLLFNGSLYHSDAASISFTSVGSIPGGDIRGIAVVSSIPEPSTVWWIGATLVLLLTVHRRRNKKDYRRSQIQIGDSVWVPGDSAGNRVAKGRRRPAVLTPILSSLIVMISWPASKARADWVYGVKSFGTGTIHSAPPANLFRFQPGDAAVTDLGAITRGSQIDVDGLAVSSAGLFGYELGGGNSTLISIDPTTAQATAIGSALSGREIRGATFDQAGNLWVIDQNSGQLLQIDHTNGNIVGSVVSVDIGVSEVTDIAVDSNGNFMMVDDQTFYSLDQLTGQTTQLFVDNDLGVDGYQLANVGLAFDPTANGAVFTFDIQENDDVFRYDPAAGFARTQPYENVYLGFNSGRGDMASSISSIPEPGAALILIFVGGLCFLTGRRRRMKKLASPEISSPTRISPRSAALLPILAATFLSFVTGRAANGQIYDWRNSSNSNSYWHVDTNWVPLGPPGSTDTARFNLARPYEVWWDATTGNRDLGSLSIEDGDVTFLKQGSSQYRLTINGSGGSGAFSDFSISGANTILTVNDLQLLNSGGAQIVDGATMTLNGSTYLINGATGFDISGNLSLNSGANVSNGAAYIGRNSGTNGTATVIDSGAQWTSSSLFVGYHGDGTLFVGPNATVSNTFGFVGRYDDSNSIATVSGANSLWENSSFLSIGNAGHGELVIQSGGRVESSTGYIARLAGSSGEVSLSAIAQWNTNNLYIGGSSSSAGGTGTLDLQNEAVVNVSGTTKLWSGGTLNLNGGSLTTGSFDNNEDGTFNFNDGTLTVDGGTFNPGTSNFEFGGSGMANPSLQITNSASVTLAGNLTVADSGLANLTISSGGLVSSGSGKIGAGGILDSPEGIVMVTGNGSRWDNSGSLRVGASGLGTLNIEAGGVVSNSNATVGGSGIPSGAGIVTVTGNGSQWDNSGSLTIGESFSGSSTLNINDNGIVTVGSLTSINSASAVLLAGGRFEFGEINFLSTYGRISGTSGELSGNVNTSGYVHINSLADLSKTSLDTSEVRHGNNGVIYGSGVSTHGLTNYAGGELRTLAGEWARFGGVGNTNAGEINNFGGVVEFENGITNQNSGFISGRGQFIANGGWTNEGVMAFSAGLTDIIGDVENLTGGQIVTSGGATSTFYDDVVHNGLEIRTAASSNTVFFGEVSGAGDFTGAGSVFFEGDLRPGNSPDIVRFEGDVIMGSAATTHVELSGELLGEWDRLDIGGDLFLNGDLQVSLIDGFQLSGAQQFIIADVDGMLNGQYNGIAEGDLVGDFGSRELFISYAAGDGNDVALFTSVPEPGALPLFALMGAMWRLVRRRRRITSLPNPDSKPRFASLRVTAKRCALGIVVGWTFSAGNTANAQIFDWANTTNSNSYWHVGSNWSPTGPPGSTEIARFNSDQTYEVWWNSLTGDEEVNFLSINNGTVRFYNVDTLSLHTLTVNGAGNDIDYPDLVISGAGTSVTVNGLHWNNPGRARISDGATLTLDGSHDVGTFLTIGDYFDVSGTINVNSGAVVSNTNTSGAVDGSINVSGEGSQWNNSGSFAIFGSLQILDGGAVTSERGRIDGAAVVSGSGSTWTNESFLNVAGGRKDGSLVVENGGQVFSTPANYSTVGFEAVGNVRVTGTDSTWDNNGNLRIGVIQYASGSTVEVADGGVISVGGTTELLPYGTISVNGGTFKTESYENRSYDNLNFGNLDFSSGTFNVDGGTFIPGSDAFTINGPNQPAPTLVLSNGATANLADRLTVGSSDEGRLRVESGAVFSNTLGIIGHNENSNGHSTVTGAGSRWENSSLFYVGNAGNGTLIVENGGVVANTGSSAVHIGFASTSIGEVTVRDENSSWNISNELNVGTGGIGSLDVARGGLVSNDAAYIGRNAGASGSVTVRDAGSQWHSDGNLYVGYEGDGQLILSRGGYVSNSSTAYIGHQAGSTGEATIRNAGSFWENSTDLHVGYFGNGTLNVLGGGTVSNETGKLGTTMDAVGVATVSGDDSLWHNSGLTVVGDNGTGTLNIESGGRVSSDYGFVGFQSTGSGTANVSGRNSRWEIANDLRIGELGTGTMNISGEGVVSNRVGEIGWGTDSSGTVTVTGNRSEWQNAEDLHIGVSGNGSLNILNGADVTSRTGFVGNGASGSVTVDGAGSLWNNSANLNVGNSNQGSLAITSQGMVSNEFGTVGGAAGSQGTVTVNGNQSTWQTANTLTIGAAGQGTLNIEDGGSVSNDKGWVGRIIGSQGTVNVRDEGSTWNNSGRLEIGLSGNGSLNIESGGQVSNSQGWIASSQFADPASIGNVTVDGPMSLWDNTSGLRIGFVGTGTLDIVNSGVVRVGGITSIGDGGSVNLNGGRFEFGETTLGEFASVNAVSGSMAGNLNHTGYTDVGSLTSLRQKSGVDITDVTLTNTGTLYGHASLGTALVNTTGGEIETVAGERMRFAGTGNTNAGEINNFGGIVRFDRDLTNQSNGFISGRGQFIANEGWTNEGVMAFSGTTDILGDVANLNGGQIVTSGGATTTFYDDVVHNGSEIRTAASSNTVFFGEVSGAGDFAGAGSVFFEGDLRPGNSPDIVRFEGDVIMGSAATTHVELAGDLLGEWDQLDIGGDLFLNGDLQVGLIDGFQLSGAQQFIIADIDGLLSGEYNGFAEGDFVGDFGGRRLFISYAAGDGNDVALFTSVPEPNAWLIGVAGLGLLITRRRRRRIH